MKLKALVGVLACLPAFAAMVPESVAARKAYWDAKVNSEIPVGTRVAEVRDWARRLAPHVPDTSAQDFSFELESVPVNVIGCNRYSVLLHVVAKDGVVASETVLTRGHCL